VTHELSHVFIDAVLGTLLPSISDLNGAERLVGLMDGTAPANLFEQVQAYLCFTLCVINNQDDLDAFEVNGAGLINVVQNTYPEVSEVLTHVFDFMYFYHRDPAVYVPAIWASWDVIPNIVSRIDEYLVRTLSAVLVLNLTADDPYGVTIDTVLMELERLLKRLPEANIIKEAASKLRDDGPRFRRALFKRINLVALSNAFLYSPPLAEIISRRGAPQKRSTSSSFGSNQFDPDQRLSNPLHFIYEQGERTVLTNEPDFQKSAWMIAQLAFASVSRDDE
jgi:hypothetical protein